MYLTVQWCIHVFYLNANWTYKMLEYCTLQSIWYIFVMNHCYPYLNVYMHTFALFCTIIAPCYDMLFLIRTRGLINHPWFLAPLAYTDLCYSLDLCNNWGELFTCMLHSVLFFIWCMYMSIKNLNLNYSDHNKMQTMLIIIEIQYINILWEVKFYQHRARSASSVSNSSLCYENVSAAGVFT